MGACKEGLKLFDNMLREEVAAGGDYIELKQAVDELWSTAKVGLPDPNRDLIIATLDNIAKQEKGHFEMLREMRRVVDDYCTEISGPWGED